MATKATKAVLLLMGLLSMAACHTYRTYSVTRVYTTTNQKPTSVEIKAPTK